MSTEERLAEIERRLDALDEKKKVDITVHVNGGSGDDHVRQLAKQGARQAIDACQEAQARGGFAGSQRRHSDISQLVQQEIQRLLPSILRDHADRRG